ncbi:GD25764 [Drosophila simulans]|uniref:GD25764 n=1 Tax=Drosophila simulans TaxID=7240 RepID=B4QED2_DROSI|nr:GD25764 [Drosophila simulans]
MQVPLLHRSTQMVLLKKQIRRKAKELRLRKRDAHRRLQVMRRIRDHLLHRMRNSIDHRQRDAEQKKREQTRRAVGGMLSMYKHWLLSWSKALRLQSQLIRHQEHVKVGLRRKLRHLRRQLKKVRNPQNLVDKCFDRLFKAVRKWQKRPDYYEHVKDQDKIWEAEAQEVRNYLSEVRGRRPRKLRRDDIEKLLAPVRDRQDKTENAPKTNVKDFDTERFHLKDLRSDAKFKHVQFLLKDVIERNEVIDYIADVNGLMQEVANHEMWSKLQSLYNELKESGLTLAQIKESLAKKYLEYLNEIVIERNYARIEPPRDKRLNVLNTESVNAKQKKEVEKFMDRNWWSRKRMSTRVIPFGMRGVRTSKSDPPHSSRQSQEIKMDGGLYNKLLEQELNAEQLEREERRRTRFSSTPGSAISFANSLDLSNEEQEMRDFEWRYSLHNIRSMMNQHQLMFQALDRKSRVEQMVHKKIKGEIEELYTSAQFKRPKKHSTRFTARKRSKNLRPIEELYYSPRKTCRLQKISCSAECLACVGQVEKIGDSMVLDKCPRCGVKVPVPAPTTSFSMSSSSSCEILSSGSIEACAKNKLLINTLEDLCARCGYVHKKGHLCSRLPMNERKTKLLKRIKDSVPTAPECPSFCCPRGILKNTRSFDP